MLSALGSEPRLRIIASLETESTHVSELARRLGMSRPLLYQHLNRLEAAGLIESGLEQLGES
ncbi:MAG: winged helix-turn-helix domain-containing protein [Varibaculum cambriense]|nr:winged helix-turn-helix domain-containing protein [Varibaculum cambriense]